MSGFRAEGVLSETKTTHCHVSSATGFLAWPPLVMIAGKHFERALSAHPAVSWAVNKRRSARRRSQSSSRAVRKPPLGVSL